MKAPEYVRENEPNEKYYKRVEIPLGTLNGRHWQWKDREQNSSDYAKFEKVTAINRAIEEHFPGIPHDQISFQIHRRYAFEECTLYLALQAGEVPYERGP